MSRSTPGRRALRLLAVLAALCATGLLLDGAFDAYGVPTGSMEPLLHGDRSTGDRVLVRRVRHLGPRLRRFELAVFLSPDGAHCVKRIGGLPNESVQVVAGDLYIGRSLYRKSDAERESLAVLLFDSARDRMEEFWDRGTGRWEGEGSGWVLDATGGGPSARLLRNREPIRDDYYDPDVERVPGSSPVRDLALEAEWTPLSDGGELRAELLEEGDRFVFRLERMRDRAVATVSRIVRGREEVLARGEGTPVATGSRVRIEAVNVDNRLAFRLDGKDAVPFVDYDRNTPADSTPRPAGSPAILEEGAGAAFLGGAGLRAKLDRVLLRRDLHYVPRGRSGVDRPVDLGPDQYFFLGDNSGESLDCREWGPIEGEALLGRPILIYWPPRRMRWL